MTTHSKLASALCREKNFAVELITLFTCVSTYTYVHVCVYVRMYVLYVRVCVRAHACGGKGLESLHHQHRRPYAIKAN